MKHRKHYPVNIGMVIHHCKDPYLSNETKPRLFRVFFGDEILPRYEGIIVNHLGIHNIIAGSEL